MNVVLRSPITKIVALTAGYFAAVACGRSLSSSFDYYISVNTGDWLKTYSFAPFFIFILCVAVFILSVLKSKGPGRFSAIRRVDWTLLVVLTYCVAFLFWYIAQYSPWQGVMLFFPLTTQVLIATVILYLIIMAELADIVARIRDRQLFATLYWARFFKLYPPSGLAGLLMAILLTGNLVLVLLILPNGMISWLRDSGLPFYILAAFSLSALTYICSFVLSLSERYVWANEEKVRAERFKSELVTNVSHDIRTPLTSIINYVDLLKSLPVENAEFNEYVCVLDRKATRLKTLIGDLIEASKAGTGNIKVEMEDVNLSEIAGQIAGEFDDQFNERGLTLVLRGMDHPVMAKADSRYLWRVLENLFSNAAKYALQGTRVFAEIGMREQYTVFSLKNTSQRPIDMREEDLSEQFMRGDRARQSEGSGLGLYIAKSLVELMGGWFMIKATGDLFEAEICFEQRSNPA
jgi:signal transduction histidine kinase